MNGRGVFRVKSVQNGGCAHARDCVAPYKDVECGQAAQQIWLLGCIDPVPNTNETTIFDLNVELLTGHSSQQLCGSSETASLLQDRHRIGVHSESMRQHAALTSHPWG